MMSTTKISVRAAATVGVLAVTAGLLAGGSTTTATAAGWLATESVSPITGIPDSARIGVAADGDATAVWRAKVGDHYRVATAARPAGGAWTAPTYLSSAVLDAFTPEVGVNASGDAVAWWRISTGDQMRLQVAKRIDGGSWGSALIGPSDESVSDPEVGIAASGTAFAAWASSADMTRAATIPVNGPVDVDMASAEKATAIDVAVTPGGQATAVWAEPSGDEQAVKSLTWSQSTWAPDNIDLDDVVGDVSVAVNKHGVAEAAYTIQNGGQGLFVMASRRTAGDWGFPQTLSDNGDNSFEPSAGIDGGSNSVVAWHTQEGAVRYAKRGPSGEWANSLPLTETGSPSAPTVAMNDRGDAAIQWASSEPGLRLAFRPKGSTTFKQAPPVVAAPLLVGNRDLGLDDQGNATIVTAVKATASTGRVLSLTYDTVAPVTKMTKPTSSRVNATKFAVAWSAQDRYGAVPAKDVFVRSAAWNAGFGSQQTYKNDTKLNTATVSGTQGRTYCFAARGIDTAGNQGATSAYRCTTTPLDDRKPKLTGKWSNQKGGSYYLGTVRTTTKHGATMKLTGVKVERLALLVAKGKGYGSVAVYLNSTKLGTFSLAATKSKAKQQIPIKDFGKVRTGTIVIKVVSPSGKPVKIDGLHLQKLIG